MKLYHTIKTDNKSLEIKMDYNEKDQEFDFDSATLKNGKEYIDVSGLITEDMVNTIDWVKILKDKRELIEDSKFD